jgi:uncharacterized protein DUF4440
MKPLSCAVLSMVILALAVPMRSSAQTTHDRDVHEIKRLETVWNEAHEHGDADVLEKLWADDMEVAVPKMPVMTKDDVVLPEPARPTLHPLSRTQSLLRVPAARSRAGIPVLPLLQHGQGLPNHRRQSGCGSSQGHALLAAGRFQA